MIYTKESEVLFLISNKGEYFVKCGKKCLCKLIKTQDLQYIRLKIINRPNKCNILYENLS